MDVLDAAQDAVLLLQTHALDLWQRTPIVTTSQLAAKEWWADFHNQVNLATGKPEQSPQEIQASSELVRHTLWSNVWADLKAERFDPSGGPRTYVYVVLFFLLLILIGILLVWVRSRADAGAFSGMSSHNKQSSSNVSPDQADSVKHGVYSSLNSVFG